MADIIDKIKKKAKKNPQRIILPEGEEERIIKASEIVSREKIAIPYLLGNRERIKEKARLLEVNLRGIEIIDPLDFPKMSEYISFYCQMRKEHSVSEKMARLILEKTLNLGALMVKLGHGDGLVAGVRNLTSSVIKSGVLMIGLNKDISLPSSLFIMAIPNCSVGEDGVLIFADVAVNPDPDSSQLADIAISTAISAVLIFADVAVNPDPDSSQLADIAISTAISAKTLLGWEPRIALLSFSTKKSASHPLVDKVIEANRIAQQKAPHLLIDGDLQADAALIPEIARRKTKENRVAGRANILIFPDLNAANISYKLVQYLAKARAYGPILQGFSQPINDLSRGASVEDIVGVIAVTVVQAQ